MLSRLVLAVLLAGALPGSTLAQSAQDAQSALPRLTIELNTLQDIGGACRLTFLAQNATDSAIDHAVFETVVFDTSGGVVSLALFDFRDLPIDRPRVRQFDLPGRSCDTVGKALINGANSCVVAGVESGVCDDDLLLRSRLDVELLG